MLKLENISFSADTENGKKEILKDITLEIDGGFTAITGPNGGGKSTLAKIIAGIYRPNAGKIYLDGKDITDLDITGRASCFYWLKCDMIAAFEYFTALHFSSRCASRE